MADNFSVGRDVQAVLIAPNGTRMDLSKMTDFQHTAEYNTATSAPLNAAKQERYLPNGHKIHFNLDRRDGANEAVFSTIEAAWWSTGSVDPGTSPNGSLFIYINEIDGSQTAHQFRGLTLRFGGLGDFKSESPIKQSIDGHAQYWTKL